MGECGVWRPCGREQRGAQSPCWAFWGGFQGLKRVTAGLKSSPSSDFANLLSHSRECFAITADLPSSWDTQLVSYIPLEKYLQTSNLDFILIIVIQWERWTAYICQTWGQRKKKVPFVSLERLGKKPGSTKVFGKTPINFSWAKLSLVTPGQLAGSWF